MAREPARSATLYRMVMDDHLCPFGLKSRWLLRRAGYSVDDRPLHSRGEVEAFKQEQGVKTTPQVYINGERVGGYEELRRYLGKRVPGDEATSYRPVIALFGMMLLMALGAAQVAEQQWLSVRSLEWFVAFSMCGLAYLKLRDVESFSSMFLNYDLLARRWVGYGYVYPWAEGLAGVLMIAGLFLWLAIPLALFIGTVGAVSVFKAVYIDRRELKCACVGGDSNVPLGFVSLTENLMMIAIALWMAAKMIG